MKVIFKFTLTILLVVSLDKMVTAQKASISNGLILSGKLISAEITGNQTLRVEIDLELLLSNHSPKSLILPKNASDLKVWEVYVANSKEDLSNNKFLYVNRLKESLLGEDKEFTHSMLKSKPPPEKLVVLEPKKSFSYKVNLHFWLQDNDLFLCHATSRPTAERSPLWLKLGINLYFDSDMHRWIPDEKISFGTQLKRKWSRFGEFQFGRMYSEPIELDLSSIEKNN